MRCKESIQKVLYISTQRDGEICITGGVQDTEAQGLEQSYPIKPA